MIPIALIPSRAGMRVMAGSASPISGRAVGSVSTGSPTGQWYRRADRIPGSPTPGGERRQRAAERCRQPISGFSIRNQLATAMVAMMARRSSSVGQKPHPVPLGLMTKNTGKCTR